MIDLEKKHLDVILVLLAKHVPECEVRVFGSRVDGSAKKYSDLDLALVSDKKLDWKRLEDLKLAFSESDLPMKVDVLDFNDISENFKAIIRQHCEIIGVRS